MHKDVTPFSIQTDETDGALVIRLNGEIDVAAAPAVRETILKSLNIWTGPVVIDMARVGFIDSTGLSALLAGYQRARQLERPYSIAALQAQAAKLFEITALNKLIPIHGTVADACKPADSADSADKEENKT